MYLCLIVISLCVLTVENIKDSRKYNISWKTPLHSFDLPSSRWELPDWVNYWESPEAEPNDKTYHSQIQGESDWETMANYPPKHELEPSLQWQ